MFIMMTMGKDYLLSNNMIFLKLCKKFIYIG